MTTEPTVVTDKDGMFHDALVVTCPECSNDAFNLLVINGHNHLQCTRC